jgi:hypothetical protein
MVQFYGRILVRKTRGITYRLRMNTTRGMQSRSLCGPGDALGA